MKTSIFQKAVLLVAGVTAIFIGGSILFSPAAFYAAYGISLPADVSLTNEMRATGGSVAMLGLLTLSGLVFARFALASTLLAAAMFLAFGATRLLSLGIDGQPDGGLVTAMIAELVIGTAGLAALIAARKPA
ncbi:DUF4345 domain-containing protein [Hoeflea ulvae]|uniref:DUF4345 domain-containing protein n=1 Tax=Hoeflea ulvae TaxID=2983764 RepID=A0ABT3YEI9_9HYPH|nr:DUF4345 domain-containing protein [Hoeflea ulvae]MCY0094310.1 DUF4345 domain-containing protein [Hoeflea ulvae]